MGTHRVFAPYVGIPSFFQAPVVELASVQEGMTVVAGVPIDQGIIVSRPGARFGPRGIRESSIKPRAVFEANVEHTGVDIDTHVGLRLKENLNLVDVGDFDIDPTNIMRTTESVIQGVMEIAKRGGFPVVLGGDHYIAYPSFEGFVRGMAERKSEPRLGYLHIDSHPDFRDEYGGVGTKYNHATAARRISESRAMSFENMAWVGLNGRVLDVEQYRLMKTERLKMFTAKVVHERGPAEVVKQAMEVVASHTDAVYVSIDIDVVKSAEITGTGAPMFSGITATEFLDLMDVLSGYDVIKAVDLCEVSPPLDPSGITADLAVAGLLAILKRRFFDVIDMNA